MTDAVTLSRDEYERLTLDAGRWRYLADCPATAEHLLVLVAERLHWEQRRDQVQTSHAISAAEAWGQVANRPTHDELERRRNHYDRPPRTPEQIRAQAAWSWRRFERQIQEAA
ncbi:hypothetical protein [Amycolatopsis thermophila]|uniref:Uncharacterized protein n=1 Tax=Amycolatopsis thermophila TaxID=206084 RepID=A0ABU0F5V3_9PSEU|nr:hypothetical protein [Amycolatopsis thermophila]MDQ0382435.1 hypothetical protein [Amycolatopsis thermophila]